MFRPIAETADVTHENFGGAILMLRDPVLHRPVETKRHADQQSRTPCKAEPLPKGARLVHLKFTVCLWRGAIFEWRSCKLQPAIFLCSFLPACFFISPVPGLCR